ncbi:Ubiquinone biosynthesis hydroxylase, UbiH/UbiF/VisC/COQ6 family [Hoeflea sp. IMCC20628]|uniref:ubiquinone biosynthesis hydroxylase n=1 Tax=Hoeflea sp. IMCC20628 TaxID=1620421 RepID=UPI00063BD7C0|nr:ubiquinone biosynthesis hydroxylase [Hoeflea sp. IMCC20628]AKI02956.1 Ubiquinone biosynthesis hydroxylase, UbiH/UbiF/VisC/COQ6 family [Hoeflea sp. IMCC20628]
MTTETLDILVCGAGYVGISAALAIKLATPSLNIAVIDAAPAEVWRKDQRASAIAAGAKKLLTTLDVWSSIEPEAQAINEMVVTDSRTSDPVRPVFLTFGGEIEDGEPFAHMVPNVTMVAALRAKAAEAGLPIYQSAAATALTFTDQLGRVETAGGRVFEARLVVAADGVNSMLRDMAGIKVQRWEYGQSGIVATVAHERPHNGRAEEHFMPSGPFAILPLTGNRSSLVWTERTGAAKRLLAEDDFVFEAELERRFGHHLGALRVEGGRKAFPLGLTLAREFVRPRLALAGDAAHGIHPVAGQGLNLGFRDVAALAETIVDAHRLGLDIGAMTVLERYQTWRRFDTVRMGLTSDILTRMFSNDITPLRLIRDFGLGLVDRMPAMKSYFIKQAAGIPDASGPRLLRGETI